MFIWGLHSIHSLSFLALSSFLDALSSRFLEDIRVDFIKTPSSYPSSFFP